VAQSYRSLILDSVGSTNREAFALAEAGETGPLWIMARRQTAGRGRADRPWVSVPGNLHASLLIQLDCAPTAMPQLSLVAGVAVVDAIRQATGGGPAGLRLKWPNDILIGPAKCAGILVETSRHVQSRPDSPREEGLGGTTGRGSDPLRTPSQKTGGVGGDGSDPLSDILESPLPCAYVTVGERTLRPASNPNSIVAVIGIGIDLAWHPGDLGRAATDLAVHGLKASPEVVLGSLSEAMHNWLQVWDAGRGFRGVREAWLDRAGPAGERVTVNTGRERIEGTFADLDAEGALVITDRHGQRRTVTFGDVTLDAAAPQDGT
jgi:BirA family transcriptional regulator, biotin operon repressor / biotin---[acetyl-CoA-carboxylase] ligase